MRTSRNDKKNKTKTTRTYINPTKKKFNKEKKVQPSRVQELFRNKKDSDKVVSLFITAGYPELDATVDLILGFEKNGAEMIELGIPFSDPLADEIGRAHV